MHFKKHAEFSENFINKKNAKARSPILALRPNIR